MDGNALEKSDKRRKVPHESKGAPLPGKIVARFDSQRQIFDRSYVLLDGHSQESTCCDRIVDDLKANDVVIADPHHCIVPVFSKIAGANGYFAILQQGRLKGWFRCSQRSLATSTLVNIVNPDSALRKKQHRSRNVRSSHVSTAKLLGLVELDTLTPPGQLACRIRLRSCAHVSRIANAE